jgi:hypothetical protein
MTKRKANTSQPPNPAFVALLLNFVEGGGPRSGLWNSFEEWLTSEEMGWTPQEIEQNCDLIRIAAGQRPDGKGA